MLSVTSFDLTAYVLALIGAALAIYLVAYWRRTKPQPTHNERDTNEQ